HVHAQTLEWNLLRMVGEELRHRTIGDAATFRKQQFFSNPILNPWRWDPKHLGDILDFESPQALCRVIEIPESLPDSRNGTAQPFGDQRQRCITVDGPKQMVLVRFSPAGRSSSA